MQRRIYISISVFYLFKEVKFFWKNKELERRYRMKETNTQKAIGREKDQNNVRWISNETRCLLMLQNKFSSERHIHTCPKFLIERLSFQTIFINFFFLKRVHIVSRNLAWGKFGGFFLLVHKVFHYFREIFKLHEHNVHWLDRTKKNRIIGMVVLDERKKSFFNALVQIYLCTNSNFASMRLPSKPIIVAQISVSNWILWKKVVVPKSIYFL